MLSRFTPEQFDEIVAFRRIEPDPLRRIATILKLGLSAVAAVAGFGAKIEPDDIDPDGKEEEQKTLPSMGPKEAAAALRGQWRACPPGTL
jgi:hypothetical protein